jgi:hypothetical protein
MPNTILVIFFAKKTNVKTAEEKTTIEAGINVFKRQLRYIQNNLIDIDPH